MDEDKLEKILETMTELKSEVSHLTQRMESKSHDIKQLHDEINILREEVTKLKIQLALNDQKTNKLDKLTITIASCVITILLGFIAIRLGLK